MHSNAEIWWKRLHLPNGQRYIRLALDLAGEHGPGVDGLVLGEKVRVLAGLSLGHQMGLGGSLPPPGPEHDMG